MAIRPPALLVWGVWATLCTTLFLTITAAGQQAIGQEASEKGKPSEVQMLTDRQVPRPVTAQLRCREAQGPVTRRAFFGGYVFDQPCNLRGETQSRVVFASDPEGKDARLLQFHRPEGRRLAALSSLTFDAGKQEIGGTSGRLSRRICRTEGRWRLEGKRPAPSLIYFRQTRDCEGKTGWEVMVDRKAPR